MIEEWRVCKECPRYEVSNLGRVRSLAGWRAFGLRKRFVEMTILKPRPNGNGYFFVTFWIEGKRVNHYIPRLVSSAFISKECQKPTVNHIDGNKSHNFKTNLEWATVSENMKHKYRVLGLGLKPRFGRKITSAEATEIRNAAGSFAEIGARYEVSCTRVGRIKAGRNFATHDQVLEAVA